MSAPGQGMPTTCEVYDLGDSSWVSLPPGADAAMGAQPSPAAATASSPSPAPTASSQAPPTTARRRRTPGSGQPEAFPLKTPEREAARAAVRETRSQKEQRAGLTGELTDFATLGMTCSQEPIENIKRVLHSRLTTFQWKKFVWLLRVRQAAYQEGAALRRRPARWVATLQAREIGWVWGHLGGTTKVLKGPGGAELNR